MEEVETIRNAAEVDDERGDRLERNRHASLHPVISHYGNLIW